ncbi:MAG: hypothetical protein HY010_12045 [Acidobacteria bacterium]|nr:hypothetical protein [Acidobacteriota bacterium]
MDIIYRQLIRQQFERLVQEVELEGVLPSPVMLGRRVITAVDGIRTSGISDRYLLAIDTDRFPIEAFDVGFLDPSSDPLSQQTAPIKNPMWFPDDGEQRFKTVFPKEPRVFICIEPGFSREYFIFHLNDSWNPHYWSLLEVVRQVRNALSSNLYKGPMWEKQ